jgi:hypothetical protein
MTKEQEALKLALEKIALEALENAESAMYLTSKGEEHMKPCLKCIYFQKVRTKHAVVLICAVSEKPCIKSLTPEGVCGQVKETWPKEKKK